MSCMKIILGFRRQRPERWRSRCKYQRTCAMIFELFLSISTCYHRQLVHRTSRATAQVRTDISFRCAIVALNRLP